MARIIVDGTEYHPDQCDRKTGIPFAGLDLNALRDLTAAAIQEQADRLGLVNRGGGWWMIPDGSKFRGYDKAADAAEDLLAATEHTDLS